jgi:Domain of unknown function (DUF5666)
VKTAGRAFGVVAALVAVLTASAVAVAGPAKKQDGLLVRVVHADINRISASGVSRKTTLDRGDVTALSATSISLRRADGKSVTLAVSQATKVRGMVAAGKKALVLSRNGTAILVWARGAGISAFALQRLAQDRQLHVRRGGVHADIHLIKADGSADSFAYDRGEITAKTSSSFTLKRKDGKSVTLAVDASTKVREKGQAATLASLQVGARALAFSRDGKAFLIRATQAKS